MDKPYTPKTELVDYCNQPKPNFPPPTAPGQPLPPPNGGGETNSGNMPQNSGKFSSLEFETLNPRRLSKSRTNPTSSHEPRRRRRSQLRNFRRARHYRLRPQCLPPNGHARSQEPPRLNVEQRCSRNRKKRRPGFVENLPPAPLRPLEANNQRRGLRRESGLFLQRPRPTAVGGGGEFMGEREGC